MVRGASGLWHAWNIDEKRNFKLERGLHGLIVTALSVFESFGFCLYFVGAAMRSKDFPLVAEPKKITLKSVAKAFKPAFPRAAITRFLRDFLVFPRTGTVWRYTPSSICHRKCGYLTLSRSWWKVW